jgi:hypothetical protein
MKIFVKVLFVIGAIIGIILITALFTKKAYTLQREVVINQPGQVVFEYVRQLKNHNEFNKWMLTDPAARKTYTGTDGTKGFTMAWDSDNSQVGKGEQEITGIIDGKKVDYAIRFIEPFAGTAGTSIATYNVTGEKTRVTWAFNSEMKYPMNAMMIFMDIPGILGKDLDTSLINLKRVMEQRN